MRRAAAPPVAVARSVAGEWGLATPDGATSVHRSVGALLDAMPAGCPAIFRDQIAAREILDFGIRRSLAGAGELPSVALRAGQTSGAAHAIATATVGGRFFLDGSLHVAEDDIEAAPDGVPELVEPWQLQGRVELRAQAAAILELLRAWQAEVEACGIPAKLAAGSTAVQLIPARWLRAAKAMRAAHPEAIAAIDSARYGGRVECWAPQWRGEAVEYDIRSAYGAAMAGALGRLPDCQLYPDREPLPRQPSWHHVRVRVQAVEGIAPLPMRDPELRWKLHWPVEGEWCGWYSGADLDQPGVEVVETMQVHAGRYGGDLEGPVGDLLELREGHGPWRRAVVRQLVNSLAGKLAEGSDAWRLWVPDSAEAASRLPPGLVQIGGMESRVMAYPVREPPRAHNQPQVHSYLTARVRAKLNAGLRQSGGQALYCDTDSMHLPADAEPPELGPGSGAWARKGGGDAFYRGRRSYRIGTKTVGMPDG